LVVNAAVYDAGVPVVTCAVDGAASFALGFLTAAFLTGALFLAVFLGAFAAAFLTATFFVAGAAFLLAVATALAALANRQRFLVAAMIRFMPSALIRRFAFGAFGAAGVAGADGSDLPLIVAHLAFCARAIFRLTATEKPLRFLAGASGVLLRAKGSTTRRPTKAPRQ